MTTRVADANSIISRHASTLSLFGIRTSITMSSCVSLSDSVAGQAGSNGSSCSGPSPFSMR